MKLSVEFQSQINESTSLLEKTINLLLKKSFKSLKVSVNQTYPIKLKFLINNKEIPFLLLSSGEIRILKEILSMSIIIVKAKLSLKQLKNLNLFSKKRQKELLRINSLPSFEEALLLIKNLEIDPRLTEIDNSYMNNIKRFSMEE